MPSPAAGKYNVTDLDPLNTFERHVFHRDQFAHYLRWTHVLREAYKRSDTVDDGSTAKTVGTVVDFGCGKGNLLEVLYRNRAAPREYTGIDIRKKTMDDANEKWGAIAARSKKQVDWKFVADDLIIPAVVDLDALQADFVVSFEVAEHVGRQNVPTFLANFKRCGNVGARFYLSTPNFNGSAAGNHTYDSGRIGEDGEPVGIEVHELEHFALQEMILQAGFKIVQKFGTFASQSDYKDHLGPCQTAMYEKLKEYYDSNLVAVIMAPVVDASLARNTLWVLEHA